MTHQDQDAEVGRLVRERRDLRAHHEALISQTKQIASLLSSVGHALQANPGRQPVEHILAIDPNGSVTVADQYNSQQRHSGTFPSPGDIVRLLSERKNVERRLTELNEHLKAFGA